MKPIIEYSDFRQYMRDYYEERKRRSAFSWREFSKITGFSSCSYMKVVCDGKSKLSKIGVERVGAAMGLAGFEMEYFRAMVQYGQAESAEAKKDAFRKMLAVAKVHKVRVLEGDLFAYYDSWRNPVVRELAPLMPDIFELAETSVTGTPDATRLAMRGMHRQMAELATPALDLPKDERNFSGVTMGVSKETYGRIVDVLDECRKKIIAIAAEDKNIEQVYRLNLQLFPLTKNVKEGHNEQA